MLVFVGFYETYFDSVLFLQNYSFYNEITITISFQNKSEKRNKGMHHLHKQSVIRHWTGQSQERFVIIQAGRVIEFSDA